MGLRVCFDDVPLSSVDWRMADQSGFAVNEAVREYEAEAPHDADCSLDQCAGVYDENPCEFSPGMRWAIRRERWGSWPCLVARGRVV